MFGKLENARMIYHTPEAEGEDVPKKGDGNFRKAMVYLFAKAREIGDKGLSIIRKEKPLEGLDKVVITDEKKKMQAESQPTLIIGEDGKTVEEHYGAESKLENAFNGEGWDKIEKRSNSRRLEKSEGESAQEKSPEETLYERIKKYDDNEFFSDSPNSGDAAYIADGPELKKAFEYLLTGEYDKRRATTRNIRSKYKDKKMPEELNFILNGLESLEKIRLQEQETKKLKRISQRNAGKSPETKSRRYRDEEGRLHISKGITEDERMQLEIEDEKRRRDRASLFNQDKK